MIDPGALQRKEIAALDRKLSFLHPGTAKEWYRSAHTRPWIASAAAPSITGWRVRCIRSAINASQASVDGARGCSRIEPRAGVRLRRTPASAADAMLLGLRQLAHRAAHTRSETAPAAAASIMGLRARCIHSANRCVSGQCRRCKRRVRELSRGRIRLHRTSPSGVDAVRLGLRRLAHWAPDARTLYKMPEPARRNTQGELLGPTKEKLEG
jgi:hypothetical protein